MMSRDCCGIVVEFAETWSWKHASLRFPFNLCMTEVHEGVNERAGSRDKIKTDLLDVLVVAYVEEIKRGVPWCQAVGNLT